MEAGTTPTTRPNPIGITGFEFIEFVSPSSQPQLESLFLQLGLRPEAKHRRKNVQFYKLNKIRFILNRENESFGSAFAAKHGLGVCALAFRVRDAQQALKEAVRRGAREFKGADRGPNEKDLPAVYGVGESLIYFIDNSDYETVDFIKEAKPTEPSVKKTLLTVDHLTNNVFQGKMEEWKAFYEKIFGFWEIRYFDIKGKLGTGLTSHAMKSPCGTFSIPINEPADKKSQIQEYLEEYKGEGVQHIALLTGDIIRDVDALRKSGIQFLDVPDTYYEMLPGRVPNVVENLDDLRRLKILVDGDDKGYLLQIFTQNVVGPIFFEIIQRKGHQGFGEGNFQALFDSMERDQMRRGVL